MENSSQEQLMKRAARRLSRRRIGGLAGMSLVATTGLLGAYLGNPRIPRAYAAAVCTVSSSADSGAGSLRQALLDHNAYSADCATIIIGSSVTAITLSSNLPTVTTSSFTVIGPGSGARTVDLNGFSGIRFNPAATGQSLVISGLTLTRGRTNAEGGAVYAKYAADVAISDVTFTSNTAPSMSGGAVSVNGKSGFLTNLGITNSSFTFNSAYRSGAVFTRYAAINITGSTFTSNSSSGPGAAINAAAYAQVGITNSTFTSNTSNSRLFLWREVHLTSQTPRLPATPIPELTEWVARSTQIGQR